MSPLNSFEAYNDSNIKMFAQLPFEDLQPKFKVINDYLKQLIVKQNSNAINNSDEMLNSFSFLQKIVIGLLLANTLQSEITERNLKTKINV